MPWRQLTLYALAFAVTASVALWGVLMRTQYLHTRQALIASEIAAEAALERLRLAQLGIQEVTRRSQQQQEDLRDALQNSNWGVGVVPDDVVSVLCMYADCRVGTMPAPTDRPTDER